MQKDPRTGGGHWRGCHSFTNIVCDGDVINAADGRNGGLKMGGTYWYEPTIMSVRRMLMKSLGTT